MKVLLFVPRGFETLEFSVFIDVMGWARNDYGYPVEVHTCGFQRQVVSTFQVPIIVDKLYEEIKPEEYEALAIPGGFEEFGYYEEAYDERLLEMIREFHTQGKPIASVCVGALPIGKSGVLRGRRATTYHLRNGYRQKQLLEFGVELVNKPVVTDHNIITSYCPQTGPYVALKLLELLISEEAMIRVRDAMGYLPLADSI